jgi:hypothetical protein
MRLYAILLMLGTLAGAQCSPLSPGPGTQCAGPVVVQPPANPVEQSSFILVDIGQPPPTPAAKQYILSVVTGTVQESDNGGAFHTLVGPQGNPGSNGRDATISIGTVTSGTPPAVTNSGTPGNATFNFVLQPGATGAVGQTGPPGVDSFAIGSSMTVIVTGCNIVGAGRQCILKRVK